jgi:hypothetical protein
MKSPAFLKMPWDMVVFLTITTVGFGIAVKNLSQTRLQDHVDMSATEGAFGNLDGLPVDNAALFDLGCVERRITRERVTANEGSIRLRGRFCHLSSRAMRAFAGVRIRNLTNGYEGTIFLHGFENSFVTDYVMLESGRNVIELEWRDKPNAEARQYVTEVFER